MTPPTDSSHWAKLTTEQRNPRTRKIDTATTDEIVHLINEEDRRVPEAVSRVAKHVAQAVDLIVDRFRKGGRLFYVGAGTSGRLGVLDAAECPPTFGTDPSLVQGLIAGGDEALVRSKEGAEDERNGSSKLDRVGLTAIDTVVGIAASGVTPYVTAALVHARDLGAGTIFLTCNPQAASSLDVDVVIAPDVGPEAITGSTRLKAGTATKLVLNTLTTASMVRLGKVYENLMVDLTPSCDKLRDRSRRILCDIAGIAPTDADAVLDRADGELKTAIVMQKRAVSAETARKLLRDHDGAVRSTLEVND
ncbi:MAG: N-acetylmuramic acid 6-phosphate etherase [Gemmatimonadetes bacterium]|nr:N-acetylmuramic acid 6-phosphate etherase [Gemmatimonadota bacterium]